MANNDNVRCQVEIHQALSTAYTDNVIGFARGGRYGEVITQDLHGGRLHMLANEGTYYVATNPTPGTGIAGIAAADGFDDTEALLQVRNGATAADGRRVFLDFVRLQATAAGTNGTNFNLALKADTGATRYSSGGSSLTAVNPNMDSSASSSATVRFGALVTTAATSDARLLATNLIRPVIKVIGDSILIVFGGSNPAQSSNIVAGTAIANTTWYVPPVVLGPSDELFLHEWAASQTVAASYQVTVGWWER